MEPRDCILAGLRVVGRDRCILCSREVTVQAEIVRWYRTASWATLNYILRDFEEAKHPRHGTFVPFGDLPISAQCVVANYYNSTGRFD
jgi:hypothetical protein